MNSELQYTLENRRDYVTKVSRLSLWFAWNRSDNPDELIRILSSQTPLYRLTEFWDGKAHPSQSDFPWSSSPYTALTDRLRSLREDSGITTERFEEVGFELFLPHLEPRLEQDIRAWPWIPAGFITYVLPPDQLSGIFACEHYDDTLEIHIANGCMPESPFEDMHTRAQDLMDLIDGASGRDPDLRHIGCNSWLNEFPPFLKLFPPEYPRDGIAPLGYSFNWWGQMLTREGRFHERNGQHLREAGDFPYSSRDGKCEISALREHLTAFKS